MKASEVGLIKFLQQQDTQFIIPVYQRNYDWGHSHCKQLFNDILNTANNEGILSHFIGSIVFIHDSIYSTTSPTYLTIIDGQQRLTTITLLWLAIYKRATELKNEKLANEIYKKYLVNEFLHDEEKLKLRPTQNNDKALKFLLKNDPTEQFIDYSRLIENFDYFYARILECNLEEVIKGISKLIFVEISLERGKDDPQKIFESLNSTGLDLSQGDLIRNYILMGLKPKDQQHIYDNYWMPIEELTTEKDSNKSKLSDFIRDFLTLTFREIPTKSKVYEDFKRRYVLNDIGSLEKVLNEIKKYASFYNKLINPKNEDNKEIKDQIGLINELEIKVSYPFILEAYNDYFNKVITKETFVNVLELIQSYVWRRFIYNLPSNALDKVFLNLYKDVDSANYITSIQDALLRKQGRQKFPNDDEVIGELKLKDIYNVESKNKFYFLKRLENYNNNEPVQIEGNDNITVEHIFPQTPDHKWKLELGEEQFNEIFTKYLHTIANLTLSGNNGQLGNKVFKEKRDLPGKGYKDSRLFLNKYLSTIDKWSTKEIDQRFNLIAERFKQIWIYPNIKLERDRKEGEENIFDIDDPTRTVIDYVVFFDEKIEISSHRDLYNKVATFMFESQPDTFFNTDLASKIKLTKKEGDLRSPIKISDTYYIEGHLSAIDIFKRIKYILEVFRIYEDLYIKFKDFE
jgi:uncharacterized protein with ParB-like and HNH nuclease domain